MRSTLLNYLTSGLVALYATSLLAADSEPHMKTKICNPAESMCADVIGTNKLKVTDEDVASILNVIASGLGLSAPSIFKRNEVAVTTRNAFDLANTTYTVPTGKKFFITSFAASYDAQAAVYVRLMKQTGGAGAFETLFRINMMTGGQGNSTLSLDLSNGAMLGVAGDVFKITVESSIAKGTIWAGYIGGEI